MEIGTSIAVQSTLLGLALIITILRCWIRVWIEHRRLALPDYLVCAGWCCTAGWVACSIKALHIEESNPLSPDLMTDSVEYLKTVFLACYFFDIGLYCPKGSITAFYWWLIPPSFRRLRRALYFVTAYIIGACVASILTDTLYTRPISDNWSIENQMNSIWNSYTDFTVNWVLNFSADLLLFGLPFFILHHLKLRRPQKIALAGIFSLGMITITISLSRFIVYTVTDYGVDDADGNAWCTAEMATAVIVVSLPSFKSLIVRATPQNTSYRSTNGYMQAGSRKTTGHAVSETIIQGGKSKMEDEMELVGLDRKSSRSPTGTPTGSAAQDAKDGVMVTTHVAISRDYTE